MTVPRLAVSKFVAVSLLILMFDPAWPQEPLRSRGPETATVTLMLLDVEVTDREGKPIRDLVLADFKVRLDGRDWPIESVDNLCSCAAGSVEGGRAADAGPEAAGGQDAGHAGPEVAEGQDGGRGPAPAVQGEHFILYLDFTELQTEGRRESVRAAKRWIQEVMQPADQVMIVGHATPTGLRTLAPFTSDRGDLLEALDGAYADAAFNDPFPTMLWTRQDECARGHPLIRGLPNPVCPAHVAEEYHYGRKSLDTLRRFIAGLQSVPGRKQLVLFTENGTMYPGSLYNRPSPHDHERRVEEIVAEATMSRVVINAASLSAISEHLAFKLADMTGGLYNTAPWQAFQMMEQARRRCPCIYRLGITPPPAESRKLYRITVLVRGRALPHDYVTQSLPAIDRWLRAAQAVLANPSASRQLPVTAGIVPTGADRGRWDARVQVALDLGALAMLPSAGGSHGTWEVGAALARTDGPEKWEMLGVSEVRRPAEKASKAWVVHERGFAGLPPGDYRLVAFVRDKTANVFGGAEASIVLPRPDREGLAGPVLMRADRKQIVSSLPLLDSSAKSQVSQRATLITGPIPADDSPWSDGEPIELSSWVCGRPAGPAAGRLLRFVALGGEPALRFERQEPEPAGQCVRLTDRIERWQLGSGSYSYDVRWIAEDGRVIDEVHLPLEILRAAEPGP